jgi:hypothetical protein
MCIESSEGLPGRGTLSNPSGPTQQNTTTTVPQLSITPNPLTAVVGPFIIPETGAHPFALSHVVIQYQGIINVPLTVNTGEWKLVLTDGTMGMQHGDPAAGLRIPAGGRGMFTYDVNDQPGGDVFMLYQTMATQRNGTLTVTWTYTADDGSTGALTASAAVAGS